MSCVYGVVVIKSLLFPIVFKYYVTSIGCVCVYRCYSYIYQYIILSWVNNIIELYVHKNDGNMLSIFWCKRYGHDTQPSDTKSSSIDIGSMCLYIHLNDIIHSTSIYLDMYIKAFIVIYFRRPHTLSTYISCFYMFRYIYRMFKLVESMEKNIFSVCPILWSI